MEIDKVASALKELGHPTRLSIFRELVKHGFQGIPVGELQKKLDIPNSTLSHHISNMLAVGLISQERQGRKLICSANYRQLQLIINFLQSECCIKEAK